MDMFGEMDWKKKAKKAKADWEAKNGGPPADEKTKGSGGGRGGGASAPAAPSGPEQYGGPVDGKWKNAKVPESVAGDMFAEMAWKKKQKAAKAEWEAANA
jgi:hypothetical protein